MKKLIAGLLASSLFFAPTALAQEEEAPYAPNVQELGSGVFMLEGNGGNIGILAGADGVFVIDSQFLDIAGQNIAAIAEVAGNAPTVLLNTHWHGDHTGGNAAFGGTIIAHDNVRGRLTSDQEITRFGRTSTTPAADKAAWPMISFADGLSLYLNGQTIDVFHTPTAHTDGDSMVYFREANILHMGDVFFRGNYPFIDTGSGGTVDGYIAAMQTAHDTINDETQVIPGHGPVSSRADIAASIDMLTGVRNAVATAIESGMNMDEAVKEDILAEWNDAWGNGFIRPEAMIALAWGDLEPKLAVATQGRGS